MNAETVREMLQAKPFLPLEIKTSSGDAHSIRHPEMAYLAGSRLIVYYPENDRMAIVSLLHITEITAFDKKTTIGTNGPVN